MLKFLLHRSLLIASTFCVAAFLIFAVLEFSPGDVARKTLGPYATQTQVDLLADRLGLNDPLIIRFGRWVGTIAGLYPDRSAIVDAGASEQAKSAYFGNFGYSTLYKKPVSQVIGNVLGNTMMLAGTAFLIIVPLSILLGVLAGMQEGSVLDRVISTLSGFMTSTPEFALGVGLVAIFAVWLNWLPGVSPLTTGTGWSVTLQLILPVSVLVIYDSGYVARMVRGAMVEVMRRPFIRTAILKGVPRRKVIVGHALRNAMIAPFTVIMLQLNWLITGVVVTEVIFSYPGFGRVVLEAALFGDVALVESCALIALALSLSTQILSDIGYRMLNPRIRLGWAG